MGWLLGVPYILLFGRTYVWFVEHMFGVFGCDKVHTRKTCNRATLVLECVSPSRETDKVGLESVAKVTHKRLDKVSNTC